ncbi:MAG: paraquat-inducible protein A [Polyangiaceae bacterium]
MTNAASKPHRGELRECKSCGLFQIIPKLYDGEGAKCGRCRNVLRRVQEDLIPLSLACAIVASVLFAFALTLPFFELRAAGRDVTSDLFSGPDMLNQRGLHILAFIVVLLLVVAPAIKLAIHIGVLVGMRFAAEHPALPWLFGWRHKLMPWAMIDVFLLGAFVAYTRLIAMAQVEVGTAMYALFGAMLASVAADASLDTDAVWRKLDPHHLRAYYNKKAPGMLMGCDVCEFVSRVKDGTKCPRCNHVVHARKPDGFVRATTLLLTGVVLYLPANALPVMTVQQLGKGGSHTILSGVEDLAAAHMWPLAILVLLASIIVPIFKVGVLATLLVMTRRKSTRGLMMRARLFRLINVIGRWSMIDIFMLATLVGVVRLGFLATVLPGNGAFAFCAVVISTMLATEFFDPRTMWDAADPSARDDHHADVNAEFGAL